MKQTHSITRLAVACSIALALAACGGGGGGSTTTSTASTATDPLTGQSAPGSPTTAISGVVYGAPVTGATVTAYSVQADGSNGSVLGTSSATGADGAFTITLTSAPAGMVRLVATGGTFTSEADGSKQPIDSMEMVAPYVTTALNSFAITPITHFASHAIAYKAGRGSKLADAFVSSMTAALALGGSNAPLTTDARANIDILSTVPNSASDTGHKYQDLLTGLEWFGVTYDVPSKEVLRVLAAHAETDFPTNGVDGSGAPINVGNWVGNLFDKTVARTLDAVMDIPQADPTAPKVHEIVKLYIDTYMIRDFYLNTACTTPATRPDFIARYPSFSTFFGSPAEAGGCAAAATRVAALQTKATTGNRATKMR